MTQEPQGRGPWPFLSPQEVVEYCELWPDLCTKACVRPTSAEGKRLGEIALLLGLTAEAAGLEVDTGLLKTLSPALAKADPGPHSVIDVSRGYAQKIAQSAMVIYRLQSWAAEKVPHRDAPRSPAPFSASKSRKQISSEERKAREEAVSRRIRELEGLGMPLERITRDDLARSLNMPSGAVSDTIAWKSLAHRKRASRRPVGRTGVTGCSIDEAIAQGNWDNVEAAQHKEEKSSWR